MIEEEARAWLATRLTTTALTRISHFVDLVVHESERQNLIARGTVGGIWVRHVVDSVQLLALAGTGVTSWIDVGSGAGFPGMVIGIATPIATTLIEPRRKRADFLTRVTAALDLQNIRVLCCKAEAASVESADVISARAVASVEALFVATAHFARGNTRYVLPRGRTVREELEKVRRDWHGMFHVEPSVTDPTSGILIAEQVRRK